MIFRTSRLVGYVSVPWRVIPGDTGSDRMDQWWSIGWWWKFFYLKEKTPIYKYTVVKVDGRKPLPKGGDL